MNTLTGIEAERVSQILRHAIDRLQILSYVPTRWDDDLAQGKVKKKKKLGLYYTVIPSLV